MVEPTPEEPASELDAPSVISDSSQSTASALPIDQENVASSSKNALEAEAVGKMDRLDKKARLSSWAAGDGTPHPHLRIQKNKKTSGPSGKKGIIGESPSKPGRRDRA